MVATLRRYLSITPGPSSINLQSNSRHYQLSVASTSSLLWPLYYGKERDIKYQNLELGDKHITIEFSKLVEELLCGYFYIFSKWSRLFYYQSNHGDDIELPAGFVFCSQLLRFTVPVWLPLPRQSSDYQEHLIILAITWDLSHSPGSPVLSPDNCCLHLHNGSNHGQRCCTLNQLLLVSLQQAGRGREVRWGARWSHHSNMTGSSDQTLI